ncbi:MAG: hypothetical protein H6567_13770 [Lewinellaceae bacterium]|nr:hypothetical protein [Lewinellaceae bacterium]
MSKCKCTSYACQDLTPIDGQKWALLTTIGNICPILALLSENGTFVRKWHFCPILALLSENGTFDQICPWLLTFYPYTFFIF